MSDLNKIPGKLWSGEGVSEWDLAIYPSSKQNSTEDSTTMMDRAAQIIHISLLVSVSWICRRTEWVWPVSWNFSLASRSRVWVQEKHSLTSYWSLLPVETLAYLGPCSALRQFFVTLAANKKNETSTVRCSNLDSLYVDTRRDLTWQNPTCIVTVAWIGVFVIFVGRCITSHHISVEHLLQRAQTILPRV